MFCLMKDSLPIMVYRSSLLFIHITPKQKLESCQNFRNSCHGQWWKKPINTSVLPDVPHWVPQLPELIMTNAGNKGWDFKNKSFSVGSRCLMRSAIFSLVALANPTQRSTFPEEVKIIYFHSPLVFSNITAEYFLSLTNLQNSCIFEQFALENLYNGCLPMDHEKHLVPLSAKHKRDSYRFDDTFLGDVLIILRDD